MDRARLAKMDEVLAGYATRGDTTGAAWAVARRGETHVGVSGTLEVDGAPVAEDSIFRISSMTKPVTAVAALMLVEDCVLRLDDPVDPFLPELADRQVLADHEGPITQTVPADRPITLRDLLTFRLGHGFDFGAFDRPQPVLAAAAELGLGVGPPSPAAVPAPDEWIHALGTLPLAYQPGTRWLYHTSADVLGVLIGRASGQPFETFLRERIFDPLGMKDTGFSVPSTELHRFGACYTVDPNTGDRCAFDVPDGQWSRPPAFASGAGGLVSTIADYLTFADVLLAGGVHRASGARLLSRPTIDVMTTDQLTDEQRAASGPDPSGAQGWGFCVGVQIARTGPSKSIGTYGWDGGLGTHWANDPAEDLIGVLLTTQMWTSPVPPPIGDDFWTCAYAAVDD